MSNQPKWRRFTMAARTINTYGFATDDLTALTELSIPKGAVILDILTDVAGVPAYSGVEIELWKDGMPTGRTWFSQSLNPTSAGRGAIGPVSVTPGRIGFRCRPTAATSVGPYNFIVKLDR